MIENNPAIYDDESFFYNYIDLRNAQNNYNDLIEQPIVLSLIGDVTGKSILDIGCGYGAMTVKLADRKAASVLGIDVSEKMIEKGKAENARDNIAYRVMAAEDISSLDRRFDVIVSCLALHYIENFDKLFVDISHLLCAGGSFVFSMEHPMYTAGLSGQKWVTNPETGIATAFVIDNYGAEGVRQIEWLGKTIVKYHHKLDTVLNALIKAGFVLEKVIEPSPSAEMLAAVPKTAHELHRPAYLIARCRRG